MTSRNDTIFALSSGRVPAAIAVVRVSGPRARDTLGMLAGRIPPPRQATLVDLVKPIGEKPGSEIIDRALVLFFPGPASDTGEDVAEFHIHGGRAVLAALIESLSLLPGVRPAEPGEFTRRSVENGKRDLTSAEGLFDLINAETDAQRRLALRHLQGLLGDRAEDWRRQIIEASALIEAAIDFPDEEDVPAGLLAPAVARIRALRSEIEAVLAQSAHAERLREGLIVAIAGPPNAGKSTLINRLARRDVAIVSPYAGTTRDVIEVHLDLGGYPVTLLDTAGIRESDDPVEREGIRRAQERAARADLVLWVVDAREPSGGGASAFGGEALAHWLVRNKSDLLEGAGAQLGGGGADGSFLIAAGSGVGIDQLIGALKAFAAEFFSKTESSLISRARHKALLLNVINDLIEAEASIGGGEEIVAENLRRAIHSLGLLTGRVDIEDILDSIFRDFCIGK